MDALEALLKKAWNMERACVEKDDDIDTGEKRKSSDESADFPTKKIKFLEVSPKV